MKEKQKESVNSNTETAVVAGEEQTVTLSAAFDAMGTECHILRVKRGTDKYSATLQKVSKFSRRHIHKVRS